MKYVIRIKNHTRCHFCITFSFSYVMKHQNDIESFTQIIEENQGILFKVCLMFTNRATDDIRDLYQDIVCKLWEGWTSGIDRRAISTWVYRVALHTAIDQQRHRSVAVPMVRLDEAQCNLLVLEAEDEMVSSLYVMADHLPPDEKTLLRLYLDKVKLRDMALILGISQDAVKKRIQRMKEHLIKISKEVEL